MTPTGSIAAKLSLDQPQDFKPNTIAQTVLGDVSIPQDPMLQDILTQVSLSDRWTVHHRRYGVAAPSTMWQQRCEAQGEAVAHRLSLLNLCSCLYELYFAQDAERFDDDEVEKDISPTVSESTDLDAEAVWDGGELDGAAAKVNGEERAFRALLDEHNRGQGYFDDGWQWMGQDEAGRGLVEKNGLQLTVDPERELQEQVGRDQTSIHFCSVRLPHNCLESGRYIAIGNAGPVGLPRWKATQTSEQSDLSQEPENAQTQLNVFFNLMASGAVPLMEQLTVALNRRGIGFCLSMRNDPENYDLADGAVLTIERSDWLVFRAWLQENLIWLAPHLRSPTWPLALPIATGIAIAELPQLQLSPGESFALHRCRAIAEGMLVAHHQGLTSSKGRWSCLANSLQNWGVHRQWLYLNRGSFAIAV